ncbi:hypothetical protein [Halococcus sp. PRR34]|uniref:hypothetical protein n=1 Tax=Halococcus sp. PRR34 TaxID=3020830 RepID=UPI00235E735A|nr:hypothetical protein [Halococcus sp. PRR34]
MPDYQRADDKPSQPLINHNTVRAAELKAVYNSLVSDRTVQNIVSDFAHENGDNVRDCIGFLHATDLIKRGGDDRIVSRLNHDVFPDLSFEARLLYHLRKQSYPQDHLTWIQDAALETADRSVTIDVLLPQVKGNLDQYDFAWNETKLRMWRALSTQIGLITETDTRGVILSPCRRLLYDLLDLHEQHQDTTDLYGALLWIEENFFDVFETTTGTPRVHPAVSDVLQNMESEGVLEFRALSDAKNEVTLPESVHTQTSRSVSVYDLEAMPDSPAYQYPLTQSEQVITQ